MGDPIIFDDGTAQTVKNLPRDNDIESHASTTEELCIRYRVKNIKKAILIVASIGHENDKEIDCIELSDEKLEEESLKIQMLLNLLNKKLSKK